MSKIEVVKVEKDWKMTIEEIDREKAFEEIKRLVSCSMVEMHIIKIGTAYFEMWVDEEGRLTDKEEVAYSHRYGPLCGNVVLSHYSGDPEDGGYYTLDDNDKAMINRNARRCFYEGGEAVIDLGDQEAFW